jgi:hypothetical protein
MFPSAHPEYTSEYDGVISATTGTVLARHGTITFVHGNNVNVNAPANPTTLPPFVKDASHFAVVNLTGASGLVIGGNGNDINGATTLALPAFQGAFAEVYWSTELQQWGAFVGSGAGGTPPPSYTVRGPTGAPYILTGAPVAVPNSSIITAPFTAQQKAFLIWTVELDLSTIGTEDTATMSLFDGVAGNPIDTWHHTVGNATEENSASQTITMQTEIVGNGGARTFGLAVSEAVAATLRIPIFGCRGTVMILDG